MIAHFYWQQKKVTEHTGPVIVLVRDGVQVAGHVPLPPRLEALKRKILERRA